MTELQISKLHCLKKQETVGKDRATIRQVLSSGATPLISGPHVLGTGDEVALTDRVAFTGPSMSVRLFEEDSGQDDVIGTVIIQNVVGKTLTAVFNQHPHAYYDMSYKVVEV